MAERWVLRIEALYEFVEEYAIRKLMEMEKGRNKTSSNCFKKKIPRWLESGLIFFFFFCGNRANMQNLWYKQVF